MTTKRWTQNPQPIFGDSLIPAAARLPCQASVLPRKRLEARSLIRQRVPRMPGIYGYVDRSHRLIYVGKSKSLRHRLLSYQSKTPPDAKMVRIVQQARGLVWEGVSHELLALIREQELISRWRPILNAQGQPQRRQPAFIRIDGGQAPFAMLARRVAGSKHLYFGPIAGTQDLNNAVTSFNYAFRLRDCQTKTPMHFGDQLQLFPELRTALCLRHELGSCPAPCAGGCTSHEYEQLARAALDFLRGRDLSVLESLQLKMFESAKRQAFERAAIYRNQFDHLTWLHRRLEGLRHARHDLHGLFPLPAFDHHKAWLVLHHGLLDDIVVTTEASSTWEHLQRRARMAQLDQITRIPESSHEIYLQMILISWFRKHREDRFQVIPFDETQNLARYQVA